MNAVPFPHLHQLSESVFSDYGSPTSSNPIRFFHLPLQIPKFTDRQITVKGMAVVMRQEKGHLIF